MLFRKTNAKTNLLMGTARGKDMHLPKKLVLTSGVGVSDTKLNSFDNALIDGGIHDFNIVKVSSIGPKDAAIANLNALKDLKKGSILHCVLARYTTKKEATIASAVCLLETEGIGLITEYNGVCTEEYARKQALKMAETMNKKRKLKTKKTHFTSIEHKSEGGYSTVISACTMV
ncbi:MAG: arginine decarboxylase, pyruvoyl-dependent [Euryarchaeota archaeon]|nr:arginine decarboxylase, pyruvoyl-dependent [Euryarchaeota archaeon]